MHKMSALVSGIRFNLQSGQEPDERLDLSVLLATAQDFHFRPAMLFCSPQYFLVVLSQGLIWYHIIESNRGGRQGDIRRCMSSSRRKREPHLSRRYQ